MNNGPREALDALHVEVQSQYFSRRLGHQRARQIAADDFTVFDYVLAMDGDNLQTLLRAAPTENQDRVTLFLNFGAAGKGGDVPDPYYGGPEGFDDVFVLVQDAARGLLRHIQQNDI